MGKAFDPGSIGTSGRGVALGLGVPAGVAAGGVAGVLAGFDGFESRKMGPDLEPESVRVAVPVLIKPAGVVEALSGFNRSAFIWRVPPEITVTPMVEDLEPERTTVWLASAGDFGLG
ncbi:MAG: hypothetical protein K8R23_10300 [Chthoniobacter sp.]|nr:hypothetical protein [Chthoniobacter sp.]